MNAQVLIDGIVRQTTILIAQLATSGGARAPLAHIANQVFLELARELEAQGISKPITADMFGLALRSYRRRLQRISASTTDQDRSLWEAVLDYLSKAAGVVTRSQVLKRFHRDDAELVKSVLHDLCESGFVFRLGAGKDLAYRAATPEELLQLGQRTDGLDELLWLLVYREGPLSADALAGLVRAPSEDVERSLSRLVAEQRAQVSKGRYSTRSVVMSPAASEGWEAGMLDHFQAVVRTLCARLRASHENEPSPYTGGSTYSLRVWPGHPFEDEVRGSLAAFRRKHTELRKKVQEHNERYGVPPTYDEVVIYGGQHVVAKERVESGDDHETIE